MSEDVLLILFAGRLLGRRDDEWPYDEENATVLCRRDEPTFTI